MGGSLCFAVGSLPVYFLSVDPSVVGGTFFVGSVLFTSAGVTQLRQARSSRSDQRTWWATVVQLIGMILFNINTYRAAFVTVPPDEVNDLIWAPDFFGSACFLVASHLAWQVVCGRLWCVQRGNTDWWVAALNYAGSIFFMLGALAAFTLPRTGNVVNISLVNAGTCLGAVCFFVAAYLLLPPRTAPRPVAQGR